MDPLGAELAAEVDKYHQSLPDEPRCYLGASEIGHVCDRYLWLQHRWAYRPVSDGQSRRRMSRGHREESLVWEHLRAVGHSIMEFDPETQDQWEVLMFGGHYQAHCDSKAYLKGFTYGRDKFDLIEVKTMKNTDFNRLKKLGLEEALPMHYKQCTTYIDLYKANRLLYIALCKNTEEYYFDVVEKDSANQWHLRRAKKIIEANTAPARVSEDPSWYQCKICDKHKICHGEKIPNINCRTCISSSPVLGADPVKHPDWFCEHHDKVLNRQQQLDGCLDHRFIPDLITHSAVVDFDPKLRSIKYEVIGSDRQYWNGTTLDEARSYSSYGIKMSNKASLGFQNATLAPSNTRS